MGWTSFRYSRLTLVYSGLFSHFAEKLWASACQPQGVYIYGRDKVYIYIYGRDKKVREGEAGGPRRWSNRELSAPPT